jgi:GT2 family glycosyltransferase
MNAVIYLNYLDGNLDTLWNNVKRAGKHIEFVSVINEEGIANAMNKGLKQINYDVVDYVTILANDILEPDNWLVSRNEFMQDKKIGICAFPLVGGFDDTTDIIGNFTISKEVIKNVGAFNTALDPYGAIDLDYCTRVRAAGLYTKYIRSGYATHIEQNGLDAYGYNKNDLVKSTWELHTSNVSNYSNGSKTYYLPL